MDDRFSILRDPTLQFIISLLLAPLFAILGTSVSATDGPWSLAGWLVTLIIWSFFAIRSASHLWRMKSRDSSAGVNMRLRVGITTFAMMVVITAVIIAILLIISLIR